MAPIMYRPGRTPVQAVASLKEALSQFELAEHCALLWFSEIHQRKLYKKLGYASMNQFAELELDFSRTKIGDFLRISTKLTELPNLRLALIKGRLGYSKAREIIAVATPKTESFWLTAARDLPRNELRLKIKAVRTKAKARAERRRLRRTGQLELGSAGLGSAGGGKGNVEVPRTNGSNVSPGGTASLEGQAPGNTHGSGCQSTQIEPRPQESSTSPANPQLSVDSTEAITLFDDKAMKGFPVEEIPVRLSIEFSPDQLAHFEALGERLRKLGRPTSGKARAQVFLDGMEALILAIDNETISELAGTSDATTPSNKTTSLTSARRRAPEPDQPNEPTGAALLAPNDLVPGPQFNPTKPPVQIHVFQCPDCSRTTVRTNRGELPVSTTTFERLACDARIHQPGKPNRATIPPSKRAMVMGRDRHKCQAPGCRHSHHLEIHHITPRSQGGSNDLDNLITLCRGCHQIWHEKGGPPSGWLKPGSK